jgi:ABC-2 type transport system ATP-binding protein
MDDLEEMTRRILLISNGKIAFDGSFIDLRNELGCTRRAIITFTNGTQQEIAYQDTRVLLQELSELAAQGTSVSNASSPGTENIADISFTQTSLEEGLANLFAKWRNRS